MFGFHGTYPREICTDSMEVNTLKALATLIQERGVSFIEVKDNKFILDTPTGKLEVAIQEPKPDEAVNFAAYMEFAGKGFDENKTGSDHLDILHCCVGLAGESGELIELAKKHVFHNKPLDRIDVISETSDVFWYMTNLMRLFNLTLDEVLTANRVKLESRYPNGRDRNFINNNRNHSLESKLIEEKLKQNSVGSSTE